MQVPFLLVTAVAAAAAAGERGADAALDLDAASAPEVDGEGLAAEARRGEDGDWIKDTKT